MDYIPLIRKMVNDHFGIITKMDFDPKFGFDTFGLENRGMDPDDYRDKLRYKREIHEIRDRQTNKLLREHSLRNAEYEGWIEGDRLKAGHAKVMEKVEAKKEYIRLSQHLEQAVAKVGADRIEAPSAAIAALAAYEKRRHEKSAKAAAKEAAKMQEKLQKHVRKQQAKIERKIREGKLKSEQVHTAWATLHADVDQRVRASIETFQRNRAARMARDAVKIRAKKSELQATVQNRFLNAQVEIGAMQEHLAAAEERAQELGCVMPVGERERTSHAPAVFHPTAPRTSTSIRQPALGLPPPRFSRVASSTSQSNASISQQASQSSIRRPCKTASKSQKSGRDLGRFEVGIPMTGQSVEIKPVEVVSGLACMAGKALFLGASVLAGGKGARIKGGSEDEDSDEKEEFRVPGGF